MMAAAAAAEELLLPFNGDIVGEVWTSLGLFLIVSILINPFALLSSNSALASGWKCIYHYDLATNNELVNKKPRIKTKINLPFAPK